MHAMRGVSAITTVNMFAGRRCDFDGERQGRIGVRAGAGRQDVPGDREGQVPVRDALRLALLLGA